MKTICGIACSGCGFKSNGKGCTEANGHPFDGDYITAECYKSGSGRKQRQVLWACCRQQLFTCSKYGCNGAEPEIIVYKKRSST